MNKLILIFAIVLTGLTSACSSDSLKEAGYGMLQGAQQQQCREDPRLECPQQQSYEDYQRKREKVQQSEN